MAKKNRMGRSNGFGAFTALPRYMLHSSAWRSLSPVNRCAFIEVLQRYNGSNNGRLAMSARVLAFALGISRATAARAMQDLIARGFLEVVKPGGFSCKGKVATEYRATIHRCDVTGALSSKTFMCWQLKIQNTASPQSNYGFTTEQRSRKAA